MPKIPEYKNSLGEEIDLLVKVYTRPNLRDGVNEYLMYQGKFALEDIFDNKKGDDSLSLYFEYPERWANILELWALVDRIPILYPKIQKVEIKTHSVYIIQCVRSSQISICDKPEMYPGGWPGEMLDCCPKPNILQGLYVAGTGELNKIH